MRPLENMKPGELLLAMRQQGIGFCPYQFGVRLVWRPDIAEHAPFVNEFMARQQERGNPIRRMVLAGCN